MPGTANRQLVLDGTSLTLDDLEAVAHGAAGALLAPSARSRMLASRQVVEQIARENKPVYGINTGFGSLASVRIPPNRLEDLQRNLVRSHCAGLGPPLARREVRAAMLLRVNALARGHSGIRPEIVEMLLAMLEHGLHPVLPSQGSVGASGDLAPLAHMALTLLGEGEVERGGQILPAALALAEVGLTPQTLQAKEGLALINGTQVTTAIGSLALLRAERLLLLADIAGAMVLEGVRGSIKPFDPRVQSMRPHPGQARVARNILKLTADSAINESHRECGRVQDSYALRCMPQVHGAVRDTLAHVRKTLTIEANSSTDNPLVLSDQGELISCGNFHGAPAGYVLDFLAVVMADLASMSERRVERLVNPALSDLPAFLTREAGVQSGLMLAQASAASIVSENKTLAHPASVDSIPTSSDQEDHVPMSTLAARKAAQIIENCEKVIAIEFLAAAQALDLLRPLTPGKGIQAVHAAIRSKVPQLKEDRPPAQDIEKILVLMREGELIHAACQQVGNLE